MKLLSEEVENFKIRDEIALDYAPKISQSIENSPLNDIYAGMFLDQKNGNFYFSK